MSEAVHLPLLDSIRIAAPCTACWEDMIGDARKRHCAQCDLDMHNISEMTRVEAEGVLAKLAERRVCARFFRRADGTILTKDCPNGIAAARRRLLGAASRLAAAMGLAVLAGAAAKAAQDKRWGNYGWSMRLSNIAPVQWVTRCVQTRMVRWFPGRMGLGGRYIGEIALPPGPPPPANNVRRGGAYGPHEWEYRQ